MAHAASYWHHHLFDVLLLYGVWSCILAHCQGLEDHLEAVELKPGGHVQRLPAARTLVRSEPPEMHSGTSHITAMVSSSGAAEAEQGTLATGASAFNSTASSSRGLGTGAAVPSRPSEADIGVQAKAGGLAVPEGAALAETREEFIPGLNMNDLAYKAMDMLYGTTGIIVDDYPFGCVCDEAGTCSNDPAQTSCKGRAGSGSGAGRAASCAALASLVAFTAMALRD
mmetsp:Transcript_75372/g.243818  ORF Transcript_75372/g.243818 Transcript_75372/m.243818 type:complete len:226 (+) Transcript_75372:53-730(+)